MLDEDLNASFETLLSLTAVCLIWYLGLFHFGLRLDLVLVFVLRRRLPSVAFAPRPFPGAMKPMCERIVELGVKKESIAVGTLYKEMSKKPCLLDEINVLEASAWKPRV